MLGLSNSENDGYFAFQKGPQVVFFGSSVRFIQQILLQRVSNDILGIVC